MAVKRYLDPQFRLFQFQIFGGQRTPQRLPYPYFKGVFLFLMGATGGEIIPISGVAFRRSSGNLGAFPMSVLCDEMKGLHYKEYSRRLNACQSNYAK
jgi:hypothetical protein